MMSKWTQFIKHDDKANIQSIVIRDMFVVTDVLTNVSCVVEATADITNVFENVYSYDYETDDSTLLRTMVKTTVKITFHTPCTFMLVPQLNYAIELQGSGMKFIGAYTGKWELTITGNGNTYYTHEFFKRSTK